MFLGLCQSCSICGHIRLYIFTVLKTTNFKSTIFDLFYNQQQRTVASEYISYSLGSDQLKTWKNATQIIIQVMIMCMLLLYIETHTFIWKGGLDCMLSTTKSFIEGNFINFLNHVLKAEHYNFCSNPFYVHILMPFHRCIHRYIAS